MSICIVWLKKCLTLQSLFSFACSLLTVFLICQEFYIYALVKPTSTSKEEKELQTSDIPDIVICTEPGFDPTVLEKYGYTATTYYRGSMDERNFVGWNGHENENNSAHAIIEEAFIVDNQFRSIFIGIYFSKDSVYGRFDAETEFRTLSFPMGRCLLILPPKESTYHKSLNTLDIWVNKTVVNERNVSKLVVYFMDSVNSVGVYPNDLEMLGDQVWLDVKEIDLKIKSMKTQISKFIHVAGDPLLDCAVYTENASYGKCAREELLNDFKKELGCAPPLLNAHPKDLCNKTFNVSDTRDTEVRAMFTPLYFHNREFKCKTPCTKTVYFSKFMHTSPTKWQDQMALIVVFDKKLDVTHSAFSINEQTLLVRQVKLS